MTVRDVATSSDKLDQIERGLVQIAQIKHEGAWDAAPDAVRNLLTALNETVGHVASTKDRAISLADKNIFRYPILFIHGRNRFTIPPKEREQLREYLERGGVLLADACCSAKPFDQAFRELVQDLYPNQKLVRIPVAHELFTEKIGVDIKSLNRRGSDGKQTLPGDGSAILSSEPFLEGIEIDGRWSIIYSKYDISCALANHDFNSCDGYLSEDAVKLGTNIILYSMLQNLRIKQPEKGDAE